MPSRAHADTSTSFRPVQAVLDMLAREPAVLIEVQQTEGSAPRDAGAWMTVFAASTIGTIGGGHVEYEAIARARAQLQAGAGAVRETAQRVALGPSLGQCCGGAVTLRFERIDHGDADRVAMHLSQVSRRSRRPVALFGGGHVGHALANVLSSLPFALTWIDSRDGVFPEAPPPGVRCEHSEPVQGAVSSLAPGSCVLIMSFSHAEDLDIVAACLLRQRDRADLPYIGLIGSKTKWATFRHRLESRGFSAAELAQVTSPIGVPGIAGKEPEVIAVAVAAQLLQVRRNQEAG
jgi:xanthine dehydrogenase accessory factor